MFIVYVLIPLALLALLFDKSLNQSDFCFRRCSKNIKTTVNKLNGVVIFTHFLFTTTAPLFLALSYIVLLLIAFNDLFVQQKMERELWFSGRKHHNIWEIGLSKKLYDLVMLILNGDGKYCINRASYNILNYTNVMLSYVTLFENNFLS